MLRGMKMRKPEENVVAAIKRRIAKLQKVHPLFWFRFHAGGRNKRGMPDLTLYLYGFAIGCEVKKAEGIAATDLQNYRIKQIQQSGGFAFVVGSAEEFEDSIRFVLQTIAHLYGFSSYSFRVCPNCRRPQPATHCQLCDVENLKIDCRNIYRGKVQ